MPGGGRTVPPGHGIMRLITKSGWPTVASPETPQAVSPALETRLYRDPEVLEQEQLRIFARSWQFVGHVSQLPEPGGYITTTAGVEPVLGIRDDEGVLRESRAPARRGQWSIYPRRA